MQKATTAAICVLAVIGLLALMVNSYAQFERKVTREANTWRISWADRM